MRGSKTQSLADYLYNRNQALATQGIPQASSSVNPVRRSAVQTDFLRMDNGSSFKEPTPTYLRFPTEVISVRQNRRSDQPASITRRPIERRDLGVPDKENLGLYQSVRELFEDEEQRRQLTSVLNGLAYPTPDQERAIAYLEKEAPPGTSLYQLKEYIPQAFNFIEINKIVDILVDAPEDRFEVIQRNTIASLYPDEAKTIQDLDLLSENALEKYVDNIIDFMDDHRTWTISEKQRKQWMVIIAYYLRAKHLSGDPPSSTTLRVNQLLNSNRLAEKSAFRPKQIAIEANINFPSTATDKYITDVLTLNNAVISKLPNTSKYFALAIDIKDKIQSLVDNGANISTIREKIVEDLPPGFLPDAEVAASASEDSEWTSEFLTKDSRKDQELSRQFFSTKDLIRKLALLDEMDVLYVPFTFNPFTYGKSLGDSPEAEAVLDRLNQTEIERLPEVKSRL